MNGELQELSRLNCTLGREELDSYRILLIVMPNRLAKKLTKLS